MVRSTQFYFIKSKLIFIARAALTLLFITSSTVNAYSPNLSPLPPLTSGLVGYYTGNSFQQSPVKTWIDLSGAGNNVTAITGTVAVNQVAGQTTYISGTTDTKLTFPVTILPPVYTLFHVAKYNGPNQQRILQGVATNWLSGFCYGCAGVAYHGDGCGWISSTINTLTGWVLSTDRSNSYRANGVDLTTNTNNGCAQSLSRITIATPQKSRPQFLQIRNRGK